MSNEELFNLLLKALETKNQVELATEIGISRQTLSSIVNKKPLGATSRRKLLAYFKNSDQEVVEAPLELTIEDLSKLSSFAERMNVNIPLKQIPEILRLMTSLNQ
jgi:DNA-binding XRE family transcriptional regulator